ncbi:MAG TPA: hypothetical protein VHE58_01330 [Burkholderiales bacterium]|nr:hypothetical protein [Burkholderiales bacterium]
MSLARTFIFLWFFCAVALCSVASADEPIYTKSASLPPIRITYLNLQSVLDKSASLMTSANAVSATRPFTEKLRLKHGEFQVEVSGHQLQGSKAKVPKVTSELVYTASAYALDAVPVATVSLLFYDHDRKLTVEGRSPEQVDAVFASLKSDFLTLTTPFGGSTFRTWSGVFIWIVCSTVALLGSLHWLSTRHSSAVLPTAFAYLSLGLLFFLPFEDFLAGFSVSEFDPSFASRYGPEISLGGLVLSVVGIPLSYLLPLWLKERSNPIPETMGVPPNKAMQGTRRKRRA